MDSSHVSRDNYLTFDVHWRPIVDAIGDLARKAGQDTENRIHSSNMCLVVIDEDREAVADESGTGPFKLHILNEGGFRGGNHFVPLMPCESCDESKDSAPDCVNEKGTGETTVAVNSNIQTKTPRTKRMKMDKTGSSWDERAHAGNVMPNSSAEKTKEPEIVADTAKFGNVKRARVQKKGFVFGLQPRTYMPNRNAAPTS